MKILLAVQASGGHSSRAKALLPKLKEHAEVDLALSGFNYRNLGLPKPERAYQGIQVVTNAQGKVSLLRTLAHSFPLAWPASILTQSWRRFDLIVSDCEPLAVWAGAMSNVPVFHLSHHGALLYKETPTLPPEGLKERAMKWGIELMTASSSQNLSLHYRRYHEDIVTPMISEAVRDLRPRDSGHVLVYLPGWAGFKLAGVLQNLPHIRFVVLDRGSTRSYEHGNVFVTPTGDGRYLKFVESCSGVITGAGFQTSSEALFLGKRLAVVPKLGNWEQRCNCRALEEFGTPTIPLDPKMPDNPHALDAIDRWHRSPAPRPIDFPDVLDEVTGRILSAVKAERQA